MSPLKCAHCKKEFKEEDHLIRVQEDDYIVRIEADEEIIVHFDCADTWIRNRFFLSEAKLENGRVVYI